jgi:hypothetical protein
MSTVGSCFAILPILCSINSYTSENGSIEIGTGHDLTCRKQYSNYDMFGDYVFINNFFIKRLTDVTFSANLHILY